MPRSAAPNWSDRKEPILDHLIQASVDKAGGKFNEEGHYAELVYAGIEDRGRADLIKRQLYNCAKYLKYSMQAKIEKVGDGYQVRFKTIDKNSARLYMISHYGEDSSKWPYHPRRGMPNYDPEVFKEEGEM